MNQCKNVSSIVNVLPSAFCWLNIRDAVSAMTFKIPEIDHMMSGEAWLVCSCNTRAQTSLAVTMDLDELSLLAQLTVGVLLHHAAVCTNLSRVRCSNTKYAASRPAISKSELVMSPFGFEKDTTWFHMFWGNSRCQTVGFRNFDPDIQTPPAPS